MSSLFGTDGIRNKIGSYPFTIEDLPNLAKAISIWAKEKYQKNIKVLIAQDTRESCNWIKSILKSYFIINEIEVYDCNILPISGLFYLIKQNSKYQFAIMISASHNPYEDNGLKIINGDKKISQIDEYQIMQNLNKTQIINYQNIAKDFYLKNAEFDYINLITNSFKPNFLKNLKIVLDLANGATYKVAPIIFEKLGAKIITINNKPDGKNINKTCGSLFPHDLQEKVLENNADFGFGFDGDGDRVIAINNQGQIKDGDDILALLSNHPDYKNENTIIGTIMSNKALEDYIKKQQKEFIRTPVGDKFVINKMEEKKTNIGGEQSGHIFLKNIINSCDGIFTSLKIIEAIIATDNYQMNTFKKYPQKILNLPIKEKKDLDDPLIQNIIGSFQDKLYNGRILVRYSGTENLIRIMAESQSHEEIEPIISELITKLKFHIL